MLLAIDIGNTSTGVGLFEGDALLKHWRAETKAEATADQMALLIRSFFEMGGCEVSDVTGVAVANVVPSLEHAVCSMSRRYFNCNPVSVNADNAGIRINCPNPLEIGADRLVNAVAAHQKIGGPLIVIDFGTATTFDYVDESGAYCGGIIAPGISIANEALYRWTSKLPRVEISRPAGVIGKTTVTAVQSGVFHGYVGLVKYLTAKIKEDVGTDPKVIATGGLASLIAKELDIEVDRFLTLTGLRIVYSSVVSHK